MKMASKSIQNSIKKVTKNRETYLAGEALYKTERVHFIPLRIELKTIDLNGDFLAK